MKRVPLKNAKTTDRVAEIKERLKKKKSGGGGWGLRLTPGAVPGSAFVMNITAQGSQKLQNGQRFPSYLKQ